MMRHPGEHDLALHAGGDLSLLRSWIVKRHVRSCSECTAVVAEFDAAREESKALNSLPEVSWNRLAVEMKANIRLGLAAGECVAQPLAPDGRQTLRAMHTVLAYAAVIVLVVAGVWLQRPEPVIPALQVAQAPDTMLFEATSTGIELKQGSQALGLLHEGVDKENVTLTASARGSVSARFVDSSGQVTIQNVVSTH
ncbi:MAG: hypothetical protein ACRD8O_18655 [Bryobacteraceae bacterium]